MKKIVFWVMICAVAILIDVCCTSKRFKSETYKIAEDLEAYTSLDAAGDTLLGIRNMETGETVVEPSAKWYAASVYHYLIEIVTSEETSHYFTMQGKPLTNGPLHTVDEFSNDDGLIYLGKGDSLSVFYFPYTEDILEVPQYYVGKKYVCMQTPDGFSIRSYDGHEKNLLSGDDFYVLKTQKDSLENMFIALPQGNKIEICTVEGKCLKKFTASQWKRLLKKSKKIVQIGHAQLIDCPQSI